MGLIIIRCVSGYFDSSIIAAFYTPFYFAIWF